MVTAYSVATKVTYKFLYIKIMLWVAKLRQVPGGVCYILIGPAAANFSSH